MSSMEHIAAGDQVVVGNYFNNTLATVERVTKTQIIVSNGVRYRRADGFAVSRRRFDVSSIREATDEDLARLTYREAARLAESALDTRRIEGPERQKAQTYKTRLMEAKAIIDAALDVGEES